MHGAPREALTHWQAVSSPPAEGSVLLASQRLQAACPSWSWYWWGPLQASHWDMPGPAGVDMHEQIEEAVMAGIRKTRLGRMRQQGCGMLGGA